LFKKFACSAAWQMRTGCTEKLHQPPSYAFTATRFTTSHLTVCSANVAPNAVPPSTAQCLTQISQKPREIPAFINQSIVLLPCNDVEKAEKDEKAVEKDKASRMKGHNREAQIDRASLSS
jgi:hypothetical protein